MTENIRIKAALSKAMALCANREFCSEEIRIRLESWGLNVAESEIIISKLKSESFINEERFAKAFANDRYLQNKWGKVKIAMHLKAKKIPSEAVEAALDSIKSDQYRDTIREILLSHRRSIKARNQFELKGKLMRFGLSRGYESNILYDILNDI